MEWPDSKSRRNGMITHNPLFSCYLDSLSIFAPMPALQVAVGSGAIARTDPFYARFATLAEVAH